MFGVLVQSLEMRRTLERIQEADSLGDVAEIVEELVQFIKLLVLFDNVNVKTTEQLP